ncbi:GNAT family N-acetyltransferase [Donghicola mangrovi]|uniref:GNAT family N-acetyltransferase n=1 Tax=Donghicola mangrovi TaxID=2729614 RepID=A0A850QBC0_9RHOB|nr:GNAT family N-acetyltransferase [Donghicola mangrovi]NVO25642.1 GNAT family N-acetyltransferase [Donghicola mangrovi]
MMDIRLAHSGDETAIRACAQAAYVRYVPLIGREPAPMLADYGAQIAGGLVHMAVDGQGALAGFIVYYPEGRHMLLENVAVAPDAAGRGVGKALIAHCERAARQAGLDGVMLYTNAKMVENLSIYPRLGYQEVDRRTEDGFDRVYFLKPF